MGRPFGLLHHVTQWLHDLFRSRQIFRVDGEVTFTTNVIEPGFYTDNNE